MFDEHAFKQKSLEEMKAIRDSIVESAKALCKGDKAQEITAEFNTTNSAVVWTMNRLIREKEVNDMIKSTTTFNVR